MNPVRWRRALRRTLCAALLVVGVVASAGAGPREAAEVFGRSLTRPDPSLLRYVLPSRGKVRLSLDRMGPENGAFGPPQAEALLRDFLAAGSVQSFQVFTVDTDGRSYAVVGARAGLTDRRGRAARVRIRMALEPENGRWVLRELRESPE